MVRVALVLALVLAASVGCATSGSPELRVLGVQEARRHEVVFVQVTNPARQPMRLTKLQYTFASAGGLTVSEGEVDLERDVPAGQAVVVEVPLDASPSEARTLRGTLTAELDEIVKIYKVSAELTPPR